MAAKRVGLSTIGVGLVAIGIVALVSRAAQPSTSPVIVEPTLSVAPTSGLAPTPLPTGPVAAPAVPTPTVVSAAPAAAATVLPTPQPTVLPTPAPTLLATPAATTPPAAAAPAQPTPTVDVRKEAAAVGLQWSSQGFVDALMASDERAVKLYLGGGMSPTDLHKGSSAVLYLLQHPGRDPIAILQLLVDNNFDPNTLLIDRSLIWSFGSSGPFDFHSPDTPAVHLEDFDFRGPALLWVLINSAYFGTGATDVKIVDFLLVHGASDHVAKQYLDQVERLYGENADSRALHKALYRTDT